MSSVRLTLVFAIAVVAFACTTSPEPASSTAVEEPSTTTGATAPPSSPTATRPLATEPRHESASSTLAEGPTKTTVATAPPTSPTATQSPATEPPPAGEIPLRQVPEVIEVFPHDPEAFTQGLLVNDDRLFESTGLFGSSTLREVDLDTGEVLRSVALPAELFGEGLAVVNDRLIQLTWQNQVALVYDLGTFEQVTSFTYETEGWGLCHDGTSLYMTDGTSTLYERDPITFELIDTTAVTIEGEPVVRLNELECVEDLVYANVWQTDSIVAIDKHTGNVRATIDARGLLTPEERAQLSVNAVLNGIAHLPDTDTFILTGKLWPKAFEVRLVTQD